MGPIKQQPLGKVNQKRSGDFTPGAGPSKAIQNCEQGVDLILQAEFLDDLFGFYSTKHLASIKRIYDPNVKPPCWGGRQQVCCGDTPRPQKNFEFWRFMTRSFPHFNLMLWGRRSPALVLLSLHIVFNSFVVCASVCIHQTLLPKKLFSKFGVICIKRC